MNNAFGGLNLGGGNQMNTFGQSNNMFGGMGSMQQQ
jgi:hypothetical protein